jgi:hypothetical protein
MVSCIHVPGRKVWTGEIVEPHVLEVSIVSPCLVARSEEKGMVICKLVAIYVKH